MYILEDVIAEDLFLYLPKYKIFIISDVHIGYEESLNRSGILIPKNSYDDLFLRLEKALENIKKKYFIEKIVLNGDLIHEFGKISRKEKHLTNKFIDFLSIYGNIILIEGNHDKALKYIIDKSKNIPIHKHLVVSDILITHGDILPNKKLLTNIKTIIIGHEHPAVGIKSNSRLEKFKCFLKGKYLKKNIIVMPSCNLSTEGTDVLREKILSPYFNSSNVLNFEAYIVGDKLYDFGKLKNVLK